MPFVSGQVKPGFSHNSDRFDARQVWNSTESDRNADIHAVHIVPVYAHKIPGLYPPSSYSASNRTLPAPPRADFACVGSPQSDPICHSTVTVASGRVQPNRQSRHDAVHGQLRIQITARSRCRLTSSSHLTLKLKATIKPVCGDVNG